MFSVRGTAITGRAGIWGSSRRLEELLSAATEGGETAEPEHKFRERSKHVLLMKPGGKAFRRRTAGTAHKRTCSTDSSGSMQS